jgi:hypothetical protein
MTAVFIRSMNPKALPTPSATGLNNYDVMLVSDYVEERSRAPAVRHIQLCPLGWTLRLAELH